MMFISSDGKEWINVVLTKAEIKLTAFYISMIGRPDALAPATIDTCMADQMYT